ncbi:hypothetical protein T09_1219 [Trichinella sp. T9]|nr:hypothetical protein T09_1219 [Trichinella sp. T9]
MEQRPVGFQCKKNGSSITDKALQRIKACNNGMHNAESRCVRLHEWLQFYLNDTIMQREQEKEAVEMAQSICREALQVTQTGSCPYCAVDLSRSFTSHTVQTRVVRIEQQAEVLSNAGYVRQIKEEKRSIRNMVRTSVTGSFSYATYLT